MMPLNECISMDAGESMMFTGCPEMGKISMRFDDTSENCANLSNEMTHTYKNKCRHGDLDREFCVGENTPAQQ